MRERPQRDDGVRANREERREAKSAEEFDSRAADERAQRGVAGPDANKDAQPGAVDVLGGEFANGDEGALEASNVVESTSNGSDSARTKSPVANAAAASTETGAAANSTPAGAREGAPSTAAELLQALSTPSGEAAAGIAGAASDKRGAAGAATDASSATATNAAANLEGSNPASETLYDAALDAAPMDAESADASSGAKLATAAEREFNLAKLAGSNGGESAPSTEAGRAPGAVEQPARSAASAEVQAPDSKLDTAHAALDADGAADVLRQVRLRLSPEMRQAVIQLEPRELGRIAIRISVTRGVVRAELRAENATTLEALERHAPELKAALERVGLGAEGFALQLGFDEGPGHRDGFGAASHDTHSNTTRAPALERELPDHQMRSLAQRLAATGGVDTYA